MLLQACKYSAPALKFTKALLTAGVLSLASTAALAAKQTFVLDAGHTFPSFSYSHFGLSTQQSKFTSAKGELVLDRKKQTASIKVEIDMNSVETGSAEFDQHIKGADFFDVTNYPKATFVGNKAKFVKGEPVAITCFWFKNR